MTEKEKPKDKTKAKSFGRAHYIDGIKGGLKFIELPWHHTLAMVKCTLTSRMSTFKERRKQRGTRSST